MDTLLLKMAGLLPRADVAVASRRDRARRDSAKLRDEGPRSRDAVDVVYELTPAAADTPPRRTGRWFALHRPLWERLWTAPTTHRLNFVTTFLVILAGTGQDHRHSKWSLTACETHAGLGKPRARRAIDELIAAGLVERGEASTPASPRYRLPELPRDADPIYLPTALVTGLATEVPILRRVRETGDALLLRLLIDLYGLIEIDAPHGLPLSALREDPADPPSKLFERGIHAVWALAPPGRLAAGGAWTAPHHVAHKDPDVAWAPFWARIETLERIGALWFEPWLFDSDSLDAEPIQPIDLDVLEEGLGPDPDPEELATARLEAAAFAVDEHDDRTGAFDRHEHHLFVPVPIHCTIPMLRGVARLRVEADTPGRRRAYAARMGLVERASG